ncbi:unnamed protein product [Amoebophrya sp. A25]|nr:unnamed protein product [Amoebophrya sp. A25]|eukprot:GSA25T00026806001.1
MLSSRLFVAACLASSAQAVRMNAIPDPLSILPPGVAGGIAAAVSDETPYVLNLMPPTEDGAAMNGLIDSFAGIEKSHEQAIEAEAVADKQRLLAAELQKVRSIVAAKHSAFLMTPLAPKADHAFVLHAPSESASDISGAVNSIMIVETAIAQQADSGAAAMKKALLAHEIAAIGSIVRGAAH